MAKPCDALLTRTKIKRRIDHQAINGRTVFIMDDETFRVYTNRKFPGEGDREHFLIGTIDDKTDKQILLEVEELLSGDCIQFYHDDGTPHDW